MISFTPFPRLMTDRLVLRQLEMKDDHQIFFLRSDEVVNKYLVAPIAKSIGDARDFIRKINNVVANNESVYWGLTVKDNNKLIGTICIWNIDWEENKAEIGYVLNPDLQGKGLMQEAVAAVIEYGFQQMKLQCLDAVLHPDNKRSILLLERNGFVYHSVLADEAVYSLKNPFKQ
ncbi:MAG TPA: GNAT family N-acetyltransferase [Chitinophagaceae bacterium]|nr:GNAT family N-acetyltransferase [Chitinophagaceae bacterium]